ncbi:MAG: T9SS type A sorting domain-containing protein, partial [Bacteroidales bacterium]|nr:T9SS type A sorting domain-containing protein [Bacteroidales bacterium]
FTSSATTDGGFIVTGTRYNFNVDNRLDIFVLKINADGTVGTDEITVVDEVKVYPNPSNNMFNIRTGVTMKQPYNAQMEVYDMSGRLMHRQDITENVTGIDTGGWAAGTYIWKVVVNGRETETGKWIKE